jgi:hypothetical protein
MKVPDVTYHRGRWIDPVHPKYKLQFDFSPSSRTSLAANFYIDFAMAAENIDIAKFN